MDFINKLERKFGKYAVSNLIYYVLICYAIGYVIEMMNETAYSYLQMSPALIMKGQVWRLFTWIFTVPQQLDLFVIFMFLFYFWIGRTLEQYWGTFRYNLYMFSGYLFMTIGPMLIYFVSGLIMGFDYGISVTASTYYLNLASFLAFAVIFPDVQVYFMMILPIKIKWLAIADGVYLLYQVFYYLSFIFKAEVVNTALGQAVLVNGFYVSKTEYYSYFLSYAASILLSVLNFLIFFLLTRKSKRISFTQKKTRRNFRGAMNNARANDRGKITKHKCAICGRTDEDETLSFRFCSKCNGNYEYCQDHLFTHEHIK